MSYDRFDDDDGEYIDPSDRKHLREKVFREDVAQFTHTYTGALSDILEDYSRAGWLVPGVLPSGLSVLYGATSSFKSFIALDLALSVATGRPWLGKYAVEQGDVLYINAEGSIEKRIAAWSLHYGVKESPYRLVVFNRSLVINDTDSSPYRLIDEIRKLNADRAKVWKSIDPEAGARYEQLANFKPKLIIVDPVDMCFDGSLNNDDDVRTFIRGVERLAKPWNADTVLVHHTGKDGSRGPLGSEVFRTRPNVLYEVKRTPPKTGDVVVISTDKQLRDDAPSPQLTLDRQTVVLPNTFTSSEDLRLQATLDGEPLQITSSVLVLRHTPGQGNVPARAGTRGSIVTFLQASLSERGEMRAAIEAATGIRGGSFDREMKQLTGSGQVEKVSKGRYRVAKSSAPIAA